MPNYLLEDKVAWEEGAVEVHIDSSGYVTLEDPLLSGLVVLSYAQALGLYNVLARAFEKSRQGESSQRQRQQRSDYSTEVGL